MRRTWCGIGALTVAAAACASAGRPGVVAVGTPQSAHGDELGIAWPFVVTHAGASEIVAGFRLRVEEGGNLVAVRPDAENPPEADALARWRGEMHNGEGRWMGDVLPRGASVRLWALLRMAEARDPRLRVVHWPTDGRGNPVADPMCEIWRYDTRAQSIFSQPC